MVNSYLNMTGENVLSTVLYYQTGMAQLLCVNSLMW